MSGRPFGSGGTKGTGFVAQTESAPLQSLEFYRTLVEDLPHNILHKDADGRYLYVNARFCQTVGRSATEVLGKTAFDLYPADLAAKYRTDDLRVMASGEPWSFFDPYQSATGRTIIQGIKTPLRNASGVIVGIQCVFWDGTDRSALEARAEAAVELRTLELRSSLARYKMLVESTHAVPWEMDGRTLALSYISPQAALVFGWNPETLVGAGSMLDLVYDDDRAYVREVLEALVHAPQSQNLTIDYRVYAGARLGYVRSVLNVHRDTADQPGVVRGVTVDITEQKKLEAGLHQSQKLESIGRLAAGVAHEINTPVQFVSDSVHFLQDAMIDFARLIEQYRAVTHTVLLGQPSTELAAAVLAAEQTSDIEYLMEHVPRAITRSLDGLDRVATIVRSMNEFAHPDQKEMTPVDLNQAVRSTIVIARNEYKYVADVEMDLGNLPLVTCHGGDVNQAILNIIVNAAHAIGDVVKGTQARGRILVRSRLDGDYAVVEISDTGGGIPKAIHARLFDPFFTTKEVGRGTGQGLAIARSVIVERHGGELTFRTEMGRGTTFFLRLPLNPVSEPFD
ncbi:MAG: ATP-binding protein [Vicinamibacterales bacterium]